MSNKSIIFIDLFLFITVIGSVSYLAKETLVTKFDQILSFNDYIVYASTDIDTVSEDEYFSEASLEKSVEYQEEAKKISESIDLSEKFEYIQIINSCDFNYTGDCVVARSGPGREFGVILRLRNGMVLKVEEKIVAEDGRVWYKIEFDEWLRYPDRVGKNWYVASENAELLLDVGKKDLTKDNTDTIKTITVDLSDQVLYAHEGSKLFLEVPISGGLDLTPTPTGTFNVYRKTPTRYMQGPIPELVDQQYYDLPGVPWNLYFKGGAVIHGSYWHNNFGNSHSHGCVNLDLDFARKLYDWADLGTVVFIKD